MKKAIRYIVIKFDIFIATLCGFFVIVFKKSSVNNITLCFHCVSHTNSGYESISDIFIESLRCRFSDLNYKLISLSQSASQVKPIQSCKTVCFSFDDGCGNWDSLRNDKFSFCISLDQATWCCNFDPKSISDVQVYDHLCSHSPDIYKSTFPITEFCTDLSYFKEILILPFGGANYFMSFSFLSKIRDVILVTTMNESLLDEFISKKGVSKILFENNLRLVPRTSYYKGDNFYSLIGRANGYTNFLQRHMQG